MSNVIHTVGEKLGAFFRRLWAFIKKRKKLFIVLAIVAVILVFIVSQVLKSAANVAAMMQTPQTITLARADLEQFVSATGTLQSKQTRNVTSSLSYEVEEIYVEEGELVTAGQLLAQLDTSDLDKDIAEARRNIADAKEKDALSLSQAERRLQDAKNTRDTNKKNNDEAVRVAREALDAVAHTAHAYADSVTATQVATMTAAETTMNTAKTALDSYVPPVGGPDDTATLQAAYDSAKLAYESAKKAYDDAWQAAYESYLHSLPEWAALEQAEATRDATERTDNLSVENAQDSVDTLKLTDSAAAYRTQLEGYLESKEDCTITAPIAGTVTAIGAKVGQSAGGMASATAATAATSSSALFTIEDTDHLEITASVPEYDVVDLRTGLPASITADAITGEVWTGTLMSISTKATDDSGNFTIVVSVTSPVGQLAIGMNAKVNIIVESKADVFAVPYDAVTTNEAGQSVIYVLESDAAASGSGAGGAPPAAPTAPAASTADGAAAPMAMGRPIVVETGMETDYYIEITSDELEEGMIVLADPEGKNVGTSTGMGGFGMMVGTAYGG